MKALSPKTRASYWQLAGISLCLLELWLGERVGIQDPLFTLLPFTIGTSFEFLSSLVFISSCVDNIPLISPLFLAPTIYLSTGAFLGDQLVLKGAIFETIYQRIVPIYRKKIIVHEV